MAVHDYLIDHITYSNEHIVSYAYGALIEGKAVCQGYSQAFQKIMDRLGIEGRTVTGWTCDKNNLVKHEWNKVKLDDGWYFIDNTWDDNNAPIKNYTHFLINSDMLKNARHSGWTSFSNENDGNKYLYYAYKKNGFLAENLDGLKEVLKNQINSSNADVISVGALIPKEISQETLCLEIKKITGDNPNFEEVNSLRNEIGDYHFYYYNISNIPTGAVKAVNLNSIQPENAQNENTSKLVLNFDKDIEGLSINDIVLENAKKTSLESRGNEIYVLTIDDITSSDNIRVKVVYQMPISVLKEIQKQTKSNIYLKISHLNKNKIFDKIMENIGENSIYDVSIVDENGTKITKIGNEKITITIFYKLKKNKMAKDISIYFIKNKKLKKSSKFIYDSKNNTLTFTIKNPSKFVIGHK